MPTPLSMNLRIGVLAAVAAPRSPCQTSPPGWRGSCFCEPQSARTGGLRPSVAPRLALLAFKRPPPAHVGCHKRQKVRERIQWAGASLHYLPPYSRTSIRSRTPLPSSKPCCANQPSERSTVSGPPSDTSSISSSRRMSKLLRRRRIRCNVIGYRSSATMPCARLEGRWP